MQLKHKMELKTLTRTQAKKKSISIAFTVRNQQMQSATLLPQHNRYTTENRIRKRLHTQIDHKNTKIYHEI